MPDIDFRYFRIPEGIILTPPEEFMPKTSVGKEETLLKFFLTSNGSEVVFFIIEQNLCFKRGNFCWRSEKTGITVASESSVELSDDVIYLRGTSTRADFSIRVFRRDNPDSASEYVIRVLTTLFELRDYMTNDITTGSYISDFGYYEI